MSNDKNNSAPRRELSMKSAKKGGYTPPKPGAPVEKAKDFKGTVKKLFGALGRFKWQFVIVIIFAVGSTLFSVIGPKILGNATTELYAGVAGRLAGGSGIDFKAVHSILLLLAGIYLLSAVFNFLQGFIMAGISQRLSYNFRRSLSEKINRLPMSYFDTRQTGDVLSVITNDVDTLAMGLSQSATQLITSAVTLIGIIVMMFSIDATMTLMTLLILPFTLLAVAVLAKKSQGFFRRQQSLLGKVNGQVEESISGVSVIQAFNNEGKAIADFEEANNGLYNAAWRSGFFSGLMFPATILIGNISYVAIAVVGGYFATAGRITVGNIQSFIQYSRQFNGPLQDISQISAMMQSTVAAAERIFAFLEEKEEAPLAEHCRDAQGREIDAGSLQGAVEFRNVRFGYKPEQTVIKDFSAEVSPGQKIAIVGPTGAGKTTMVKLLMRFYDINEGAILVDGYDVRGFDRSKLRQAFGMVLQDTWLFSGTVADNIRYGRLDATDEEVRKAAKAAYVDHFIQTLPEGYNTALNEDASNISQGQKQLLTIARAILADNKILILDEATSSVDTRTETLIQQAMDNLMRGRTSFIIAHRLSTIRDADLVLVMNEGDIIEQGTHMELLAKRGFYADMYNSQFDSIA